MNLALVSKFLFWVWGSISIASISITPVAPYVPLPNPRRVGRSGIQRVTEPCFRRSGEENGAGLAAHSCFGVDYELSLILKELRVITDQVSRGNFVLISLR